MSGKQDPEKAREARAAFVREWVAEAGEPTETDYVALRRLLRPTGGKAE
ncbi:hypothetical protein [Streptomyces sp. Root1310]|nr:hypothetical protein [Streptomyces sp. Root1310]